MSLPVTLALPLPVQGLSWTVVGAVLLGALLHAGWNALVKSSADKDLDMVTLHLMGSLISLPLLATVGWPAAAAWPFIAGSVTLHLGYYLTLSGAYRHGDLGLTYPLMRGVAPLLVALSASALLGETLTPLAWVGVWGVSLGVLVLGLTRQALAAPRAVAFALTNAAIIACYTVVDGQGVRANQAAGGHALQYVAALFLLHGWPFAVLKLAQRKGAVLPYVRQRWPVGALGAAASLGSYGIALWAMTRAPVATVAALRETSVLFALVLSTWLLKEQISMRRVLGACTLLAGVMALRLG